MPVGGPPAAGETGPPTGWVTSGLGTGEVFLRGPEGKPYRLKWSTGDRDRRRPLAPGRYRVLGYRIARQGKDGVRWFISAASSGYRTLLVRPGAASDLEIDPAIHVAPRAVERGGEIQLGMTIQGEQPPEGLQIPWQPVGLSIYRDGRRVVVRYRVTDAAGEAVAEGTLNYG